jgi:hypothetical protein
MTRLCFLCGKKIGFLRSLADQQYCSAEHRQEARLASTQLLREEDELEPWSVEKSRNRKKTGGSGASTAGQTASAFAFLTVGGLLLAALMLMQQGPSSTTTYPPAVSLDAGLKRGFLDRASSAIGEAVRSSAPVTLHHDFHSGFSDWAAVALHSNVDDPRNWLTSATAPDIAKPGTLRLWTRSLPLQNYQMEFQGQIGKKSLNWAFRASDQNNYYASKLVITKPGPQPNASLLRYVVQNGQELERSTSPLFLTLEKGRDYRIRVSVEDDHFVTFLNGQRIGEWIDRKLHRGGVGFIAEDDDPQQVAWVNVSERDSFLGRMLAHFSLFVVPGQQ